MSPLRVLVRTDSSREDKISSSVETARSKNHFHELVVVEIEEDTPEASINVVLEPNTPNRKGEV